MRGTKGSFTWGSVFVLVSVLSACGQPGMGGIQKFVDQAPQSAAETGLIVRFDSKHQADQYFETHNIQVRTIHEPSLMYEVRGVSEEDFRKEVGAHQFLQKNKIIKGLVPKLRARAFFDQSLKAVRTPKALKSKSASTFDVSKCVFRSDGNPKLPIPKPLLDVLEPISLRDAETPKVKLGTTIKFDSSRTKNSVDGIKQPDVFWKVWGPIGSVHSSTESYDREFTFTPDMPGAFDITLLARDEDDHCAFMPYTLGVSYAEPYEGILPARAFETKDRQIFTHLSTIFAETAWKTSDGGDQIIAILDSGVNYNHPDLAQNIFVNSKNEYGKDMITGSGMPFDDFGHGTHVAGLAASAVTGVARRARILPVKVLDGMGDGDLGSILAGMAYAADQGAKILNMSLSSQSVFQEDRDHYSAAYLQILKEVGRKGAVVISAAGNDDKDIDEFPVYPAVLSTESNILISVAATQLNGEFSEFSNYGAKSVTVAAPGGSQADANPSAGNENGGLMSTYYWPVGGKFGYVRFMGTSMAAPVTSGIVALLREARPDVMNYQIKAALIVASTSVKKLHGKLVSGGLLNAAKAVASTPTKPPSKGWTKN